MLTNGTHKKTVAQVEHSKNKYQGRDGNIYVHKVTFTDGTYGENHTKSEQCKDFVANQEVEFICEVKVNGNYTNYKIKFEKDKKGNFGGGGSGRTFTPNNDGKYMAAAKCIELSILAVEKGVIKDNQISETTTKFYKLISGLVEGQAPATTEQTQ